MDTASSTPQALLVGIQLPRIPEAEVRGSLAELQRLVHTLGYQVVGLLTQKRNSTSTALVVGEGKLREIAQWTGGRCVVAAAFQKKKSKAAERFAASDEPLEDATPPEGVRASIV